jgi:hypothetical protein
MTVNTANPLAKHFRQPALYISLPSNGKFWPNGSLDLPITGEMPIYPMTAKDEITIRTPDALMNGQGVVDVIQSCCPCIKDAWKMPSIDVDAILLSIRSASYGNEMDFDAICPKCNDESNFALDLSALISRLAMPNYEQLVVIENLQIKLKPQPYYEVNRINQITFTEQQILRTINDDSLSEEDKKIKNDQFLKKIIELNVEACINSTQSITTQDGTVVTDVDFIREFYNNASFRVMKEIQARLVEINEEATPKPMHITCEKCSNEYDVPLVFDYANFFV